MSVQIPTRPNMGRSIIQHDPRSKNFPVSALLGERPPRRNRSWRRPPAWDQGQRPVCVGEATLGLLWSLPLSHQVAIGKRRKLTAEMIYHGAQTYDEWPGENYDGTSALGACKFLYRTGLISAYHWCFGADDVIDTICNLGPVAIGIRWTSGMMDIDPDGYIRPIGDEVGGHEVELTGVDVKARCVIGTNSWGKYWGDRGRFRLDWADLAQLLAHDGDAVVITEAVS